MARTKNPEFISTSYVLERKHQAFLRKEAARRQKAEPSISMSCILREAVNEKMAKTKGVK